MRGLIEEYKKSLRLTYRMLRRAEYPSDRALIGGMISDLRFAIEWMEKGSMPGRRRGIERRAGRQREIPTDPQVIEETLTRLANECSPAGAEQDWERIDSALEALTEREKEIFLMAHGGGMSYERIADCLHIKKGTVQDAIKRARRKLNPK
ncbi:sigma-70 family RNA polymerase sigma factor [Paenibacillus naphthalenovorans]|uniref:sigma-70 family RNA polymerase sigma factor n=1 Tax=Paenibacillus naphthalenovorans TaxID=162209 RepID=UPI003D28CBD0